MEARVFDERVRQALDEIWNRGDLDRADGLVTAEFVNHGGLIPDLIRGPEAIKIAAVLYRLAFPALRIVVDDLTASDESLELRWTARAAPTADAIAGVTFGRIVAGRIVESWTYWDAAGGSEHDDRQRYSTRQPAA